MSIVTQRLYDLEQMRAVMRVKLIKEGFVEDTPERRMLVEKMIAERRVEDGND